MSQFNYGNVSSIVFDDRKCLLGEGIFCNPITYQIYWFDILSKKLLTQHNSEKKSWHFKEFVSAGAFIKEDIILVASEKELFSFNLQTNEKKNIVNLEDNKKKNRSNDGCVDPWGGFWISTMGKKNEIGEGSIYRFYNRKIKKIFSKLTIPNSICFSKKKDFMYFSDTYENLIYKQKLNPENGWPIGNFQIFLNLKKEKIMPDGSVIDENNNVWFASWGNSELICLSESSNIKKRIKLPIKNPTSLIFGKENSNELFITSAAIETNQKSLKEGMTFKVKIATNGNSKNFVNIN